MRIKQLKIIDHPTLGNLDLDTIFNLLLYIIFYIFKSIKVIIQLTNFTVDK